MYVGSGVGSMILSSGRSPVPGLSEVGLGVRMLVETSSGAGVGVGSPPKMPQATVTGRTSIHTARRAELMAPMIRVKFIIPYYTSDYLHLSDSRV